MRLRYLSREGLTQLQKLEGLRLDAYLDSAGVWTIGYGDTRDVQPGLRITLEEADKRLLGRVAEFEQSVRDGVKSEVSLSDSAFDALVIFAYNVGRAGFSNSKLLQLLNANDRRGAALQFGEWIHVRGDEQELCQGAKGAPVVEWQTRLSKAGLHVVIDGSFGPMTSAATAEWQKRENVKVDGIGRVRAKVVDRGLVARRFVELVWFLS